MQKFANLKKKKKVQQATPSGAGRVEVGFSDVFVLRLKSSSENGNPLGTFPLLGSSGKILSPFFPPVQWVAKIFTPPLVFFWFPSWSLAVFNLIKGNLTK